MSLPVEHLSPRDSLLAGYDPRWRLATLLTAAVSVLFLRLPTTTMAALAVTMLLVILAKLPVRWYLARILALLVALLPFAIVLPLIVEGNFAWRFLGLRWSDAGFVAAGMLIVKSVTIVSLMLILLGTAPLHATARAARQLGCPGVLVQILLMTYRYIFLLLDELGRLRVALRVRGFRNRGNLHGYRTIGQATGTLLVRGSDRAERVAQAMRCRGFDGQYRTTAEFRTRPRDIVLTSVLVLVFAVLLFADRPHGK